MSEHAKPVDNVNALARPAPMPPATPPVTTTAAQDIATALGLADYAPRGPLSADVIARLRWHIRTLYRDATTYAYSLPHNERRRDVAIDTIRFARSIVYGHNPNTEAALRLHAKATQHLGRYAAAHRRS